ncbi:MAG: efflux RND transporter permease subunit [Bryobacteraceae bacterium]
MIPALMRLALSQRLLTVLCALLLAGLGIWAYTELKVEAYPDLSDLQVTVITQYPGYAPEEVEQQVTIPIERALSAVPNVIGRRSRTIFGLSVIDLTFAYGVPEYQARQAVLERLRDAALPEGVEPTLAPPTTPAGELFRYVVEGEGRDERELREIQDWVIAPRMLQVPGVGDAFAFGGLVKQYEIAVDPMALYKYNLSIERIAQAVAANNQNAGGSLIRSGEQALVVRGIARLRSVADIENVMVTAVGGTPVFVRDIGRVRVSEAPRTGIFGLDRRSGLVEGIVAMRRGENASETLRGIREAVEELNHGGLPPGVRIRPIYDRTELVNNTRHTVSRVMTEGMLIVLLVLLFFLGSLRAALLTALVIPLSLLFAFTAMHLCGITASLLSLGAIDFGIIVDGTLVMVECMVRRLQGEHQEAGGARAEELVWAAALEIQRPIVFSLLILITAYIPLFTLERVERRLFMPMAFTIAAALVGSLMLTVTLVPTLATWLFPRARPWSNPLLPWMLLGYGKLLEGMMARPRALVLGSIAVVGAGVLVASRLGTEFLPHLDEGTIWVRMILPPGISLEKSAETANRLRELALESPEVSLVTSQTGRQTSNTEPFGPNRTECLISLKPYSQWAPGKKKMDLVQELEERFRAHIPGATFNFTQPIIDMVMEAVTGSSADLAVLLCGPDLGVLRAAARQTLEILRGIRGAADTAVEQEADQPQLRIRMRREEAARYGINAVDLQNVIELAIGGRSVSVLFEGDRRFDVVVRYVPEARSTLEEIGNILVPTADGGRVPLARVAEIGVANGASIIARRENQRLVSVRTNIRGRDQGSFVAEAQKKFRERVKLPPGYKVEWGGQFENLARARRRLSWILPVTVLIIFGLLYWAFGSIRDAAIVMLVIPFSMVGGVAALAIRGMPFSVSAAVGFVSLFGVAVMSGVLCLTEINRLRRCGEGLEQSVVAGACSQLRPRLILLTAALLGICPATFATGIGSDVQRPLATVVFGGLISTLVLTMPALPGLYYVAVTGREKGRARA